MVLTSFADFEEHYDAIRPTACIGHATTIMIFVAMEVDAVSAARMLCNLLQADKIPYNIQSVANFDQLMHIWRKHKTPSIKTVFMVNCGAIHDIPRHLELETGGDLRCFLIDNHRPVHLKNCFSKHNVVVFGEASEQDDLPSDCSDMSDHDSDSDSSDNDSSSDGNDDSSQDSLQSDGFQEEEQGDEAEAEGDSADGNEHPANGDDEEEDEDEDEEGSNADDDVEAKEEEDLEEDLEEGDGGPESDEAEGEEAEEEQDEQEEAEKHAAARQTEAVAAEGGDEDEDDDHPRMSGRRRRLPAPAVAPGKLKKQRIQQYYRQANSYAAPSAVEMLPFVKARFGANGSTPVDTIWLAILGLTDQHLRGNVSEDYYSQCCAILKVELGEHLSTANGLTVAHGLGEAAELLHVPGEAKGHVTETMDYRFFLYRHWALFDAISHSPTIATKFSVWKADGLKKLQVLLAEIGVSLQQCAQTFQFMEPQSRRLFENEISSPALLTKHNLCPEDILFKSFSKFADFKSPLPAADLVISATALFEHCSDAASGSGEDVNGAFHSVLKLLSLASCKGLAAPAKLAINIQRAIVKQASAMLDGQDSIIHRYHRFYCAHIRSSSSTSNSGHKQIVGKEDAQAVREDVFSKPSVLTRLGRYVMTVKRSLGRSHGGWSGNNLMPLLVVAELASDYVLVLGISPLSAADNLNMSPEQLNKLRPLTNFQQFFKLAAKDIHVALLCDSFDPNCVKVAKGDAQDFLGSVDTAMRKATQSKSNK